MLRAACQLHVAQGRVQAAIQALFMALPVVSAGTAAGVPSLILTVLAGVLTSQACCLHPKMHDLSFDCKVLLSFHSGAVSAFMSALLMIRLVCSLKRSTQRHLHRTILVWSVSVGNALLSAKQEEAVVGQAHALLQWLRNSPAWSAELHAEVQLLWAAADAACGAGSAQVRRLQAQLWRLS